METQPIASADPTTAALFTPVSIGQMVLPNRLVMAPLTRLRAEADGCPNALLVEHYRQRASLGLIVTEGTWPVQEGRTWIGQPGIATQAHIDGWRQVADAVHEAGGRIVMQVMHGGRMGHPAITGTGRTVAPSPIAPNQYARTERGKEPMPVPHALTQEEIPLVIDQFVQAAHRAMEAGMDGVQLHGANGYLISQFLTGSTNHRKDTYGASPADRARFAIEVAQAVCEAIGAEHTGMRISPARRYEGMAQEDASEVLETYLAFAEGIRPLGLAHLDILHEHPGDDLVQRIRQVAGAPLIANTGFGAATTREEAASIIADGLADAVGIGRAIIANPDLVKRWQSGGPENSVDESTFYFGGAHGYTDYPMWDGAAH